MVRADRAELAAVISIRALEAARPAADAERAYGVALVATSAYTGPVVGKGLSGRTWIRGQLIWLAVVRSGILELHSQRRLPPL